MPSSRVIVELGDIANTCFVAMPFHALFAKEYERVIRPAVQATGLQCVRGDETHAAPTIVQDIWLSLRRARLVLAELSGRNPNVMYEVGLAHALGKPIILLTREQDDMPFDLKALRYIYYDVNNPDWGADLRAEITRAIERAIENPSLAVHLAGIQVETPQLAAPPRPVEAVARATTMLDLGGAWRGKWLSIQAEREHRVTLVIPAGHGADFTASMTVDYERNGQQTVVEQTMKGTLVERMLSLVGVSYSYIQRGASVAYSLDSFELRLADDEHSLTGKAMLRNGVRYVTLTRDAAAPPPPAAS